MKPWQMIKIVLSALWLGVTLAGLIYWTVTLAYPWNPTNLWLVPLYLAFPLWAFVGALRKKERTRAYRTTKTVVLVLALIPLLLAHGFSFWVAVSNEETVFAPETVFGPYRLSSETDDPASYGKWDDDMSNLFFPAAIPADATDAAFHYCDVGSVTVFFQDSVARFPFLCRKHRLTICEPKSAQSTPNSTANRTRKKLTAAPRSTGTGRALPAI